MSRETKEKIGTWTHDYPKGENCSNCRCCISYVIEGSVGFRRANIEIFECHRYPPEQDKSTSDLIFPQMDASDWCYEWKSRTCNNDRILYGL